jgi:hypothetical protein
VQVLGLFSDTWKKFFAMYKVNTQRLFSPEYREDMFWWFEDVINTVRRFNLPQSQGKPTLENIDALLSLKPSDWSYKSLERLANEGMHDNYRKPPFKLCLELKLASDILERWQRYAQRVRDLKKDLKRKISNPMKDDDDDW